jgi:hypothetical protein
MCGGLLRSLSFHKRITAAFTSLQALPKIWVGLLVVVATVSSLALPSQKASAAVGINSQINYQGRLLNAAGATVPDGFYNLEFKIYQDGNGLVAGNTGGAPAGVLKWTEDYVYATNAPDSRVRVKNGYFSVALGSICPLAGGTCTTSTGNAQSNPGIDFNQDTLYLSVNIGNTTTAATFATASGDGEMLPMRRLTANPYALNSGKLGGITAAGFLQLGVSAAQADAGTNTSLFLNKTAAGNILDLQRGGADVILTNNNGQSLFRPTVDSLTALQVQKAGTSTVVFTVDSINSRIGIGTGAPAYAVDAVGSINASVDLKVAGTTVCTSTGCTSASGSGSYIQNQNAGAQASSNFNISGSGTAATFTGTTSITTAALNAPSVGGTITTNAGTIQRTATGTTILDLNDAGTTVLQVKNSGSGVANLNLFGGSLTTGAGGTVRLDNAGNLQNIGTYSGTGTIATTGDFNTGNEYTRSFTRTIPTTIGNEVDLGSFALTNGGGNLQINLTVPSGGYSQAKTYNIPIAFAGTGGAWQFVQPISDTGPYTGNDFTLEINVNSGTASLRLRRTAGATAGTAYIVMAQRGIATDAWTPSVATSAVAAPTAYYSAAIISQTGGAASIQGSLNIANSGVIQTSGTTRLDSAGNLSNIGTIASGAITSSSTIQGTVISASAGLNVGSSSQLQVAATGLTTIASATGGPLLTVREVGSGYASGAAAITANTDNPTGTANYLYAGQLNGTSVFTVRADGQGFFAGSLGVGIAAPVAKLDVRGSAVFLEGGVAVAPLGTSAAEFRTSANSLVTIGESSAGNANPAITLYRTSAGANTGTGSRIFNPDSSGTLQFQTGTNNAAYGSETYTTNLTVTSGGVANATTGFQIGGTAATGQYLRGNGTNFVSSGIQSGDIPTGSANYIQNQTGSSQVAGFNINGAGTVSTLTVSGAAIAINGTNPSLSLNGASSQVAVATSAGSYSTSSALNDLVIRNTAASGNIIFQQGSGAAQLYVQGSTGNIGIGNSNPLSNLQLGTLTSTVTATPESLSLGGTYSSTAGTNVKLRLYDDGSTRIGLGISNNQFDYVSGGSTIDHVFYGGGSTELLRIKGTGNIGIGTSTPTAKLQVAGGAGFQGTIAANTGFNGNNLSENINANSFAAGLNMTLVAGSTGGTHTADGKFIFNNTSNAWTGGFVSNSSYARVADRVLEYTVDTSAAGVATSQADHMMIGWGNGSLGGATNYTNIAYGWYFNKPVSGIYDIEIYEDGIARGQSVALTWGDVVTIRTVLKATGADYYYKLNTGKWRLNYSSAYSSATPLYPSIAPYAGRYTIHSMHVYDSERTIATDNGNVGIGTTTPGSKLDVQGGNINTSGSYLVGGATTNGAIFSGAAGYLNIRTGTTSLNIDNNAGNTNLITVQNGGNVGIGATSPATKLHVLGSTNIDGIDVVGAFSSSDATRRVDIGYSVAGDYGEVSAVQTSVAWKNLALQRLGGSVGIGTGTPGSKLDVQGGNISTSGQLISQIVTGTAPLSVASTTQVPNLNVSYLGGYAENQISENQRSNVNITGGGTVTYSGGISWTSRFIVISNGNGSDFSTNGYFDINEPANGTVITGVGGHANATVAGGYVPLSGWDALYYILPIGSGNPSLNANFRIASYTSALQVPSNWVLVSILNGDNNTLRLGIGKTLRSGQTVTNGSIDNPTFNTSATSPTVNATSAINVGQFSTTTGNLTFANSGSAFGGTLSVAPLTGSSHTYQLPNFATAASTICVTDGTTSNCPAAAGSASYIQNQTASPQAAGFNINGAATIGGAITGNNGLGLNSTTGAGGSAYSAGVSFNTNGGIYRGYVGAPDPAATIAPNGILLYGAAGSALTFYSNAAFAATIDTNGRLGVGVASPSYTLDVQGVTGARIKTTTNSTSAFQVQNSASATPVFNVDTTNNAVGINTSTPQATFDLASASTGTAAILAQTNSSGGDVVRVVNSGTGSGSGGVSLAVGSVATTAPTPLTATSDGYASTATTVVKLDSSHFVSVHGNGSCYGTVTAEVGQYLGTSIVYGSPSNVAPPSTLCNNGVIFAVAALDSTHFVVASFNNQVNGMVGFICTTTGTNISCGASNSIIAASAQNFIGITALDSTHFAVSYLNTSNTTTNVVAATVSGNTITPGTPVSLGSINSTFTRITTMDSTHFVMAYSSSTSSSVIAGSVSGATITLGSAVQVNASNTRVIDVTSLSASSFALAYAASNNGNAIYALTGSLSTTTITLNTQQIVSTSVPIAAVGMSLIALSATSLVATYGPSTTTIAHLPLSLSGTTFSSGSEATNLVNPFGYVSTVPLSSSSFIVDYGTSTTTASGYVATVSGSVVTGSAVGSVATTAPTPLTATSDGYASTATTVVKLDSSHFVSVHGNGSCYGTVTAEVGQYLGTSIVYGSPSNVAPPSTLCNNGVIFAVAALDSTHFVVASFNNQVNGMVGFICTTTGTNISCGASNSIIAASAQNFIGITALDSTHFAVSYLNTSNTTTNVVAATVSGNTITPGTPVSLGSINSTFTRITTMDSTHFVMAYSSSTSSSVIAGSVSGATITLGSAVQVNASNTRVIDVTSLSASSFALAYAASNNGNAIYALTGSLSTTTITLNTQQIVSTSVPIAAVGMSLIALSATSLVATYGPSTTTIAHLPLSLSGTTFSSGSEATNLVNPFGYVSTVPLSSSSFIVDYGTSTTTASGYVATTGFGSSSTTVAATTAAGRAVTVTNAGESVFRSSGTSNYAFQIQDAYGNALFTLDTASNLIVAQDSSGANVLTIDLTNHRVGIGTRTPGTALSVNGGNNITPQYPDGLVGTPVTRTNASYTVPAGKTLYIAALYSNSNGNGGVCNSNWYINSILFTSLSSPSGTNTTQTTAFPSPIRVGSGGTVSASLSGSCNAALENWNGILVNSGVTPITHDSSTYTVPAGKTLYISNAFLTATGNGGTCYENFIVAGYQMSLESSGGSFTTGSQVFPFASPVQVASGDTVQSTTTGSCSGNAGNWNGNLVNSNGLGGS